MQSNQQLPRSGYLYRVLADGARPFSYRGGVRSLLGMPDSDGSVSFAAPLPSVGFRYADRAVVAGPDLAPEFPASATPDWTFTEPLATIAQAPQETGPAGAHVSPTTPVAAQSDNRSLIEERPRQPNATAMLEAHRVTPGPNNEAEQSNAVIQGPPARRPSPSPSAAADDAPLAPAQDAAPVQPTHIDVPGVSRQPRLFSNLASPGELQVQLQAATTPTAPRVQTQVETAPGSSHPGAGKSPGPAETDQAAPRVIPPSIGGSQKPAPTDDQTATMPPRPIEASTANRPPVPAADNRPPPFGWPVLPGPAPSPVAQAERSRFVAASASGQAVRPANPAHLEAAAQIDHLRHTVGQLTSRLASQPAQPDRAPRQEEPAPTPPPSQPVVIVNRSPDQPRTPRAFWERRYLRRARLRGLR